MVKSVVKSKSSSTLKKSPKTSSSTSKKAKSGKKPLGAPPADIIAESAYFKAEKRGFEPGYEMQDWLEAEQELTGNPA